MIEYRLLVDLEAVVELDSLPKRDRRRLLLFFEKLRSYPEHFAALDAAGTVGGDEDGFGPEVHLFLILRFNPPATRLTFMILTWRSAKSVQ